MKQFWLSVWDGYQNRRVMITAPSYEIATHRCTGFPPGYIWSIEPVEPKVLKLGKSMTDWIPLRERGPVNVHAFSWRGSRL